MRSSVYQTAIDCGSHNYFVDSVVGVCIDQNSCNPFSDHCHISVEHMLAYEGPTDVVLSSGLEQHLLVYGCPNRVGSAFEYVFGFVDPFLFFYLQVFAGGKADVVSCGVDSEIPQKQILQVDHM